MTDTDQEGQEISVEAETTAPETDVAASATGRNSRKVRVGVVTSNKADKTVTVVVERRFAHPLYVKQIARTRKYHAHDENNEYREGDVVRIVETRPLSKMKRWRVVELIERRA